MNSPVGIISRPEEHPGLDTLRDHLGADQAHQFPLGIKGHEAIIVISFIERIRTRIGEIYSLSDALELGDLIQGFIDVLKNYESSVDQMSYHVIENHQKHSIQHIQQFCIRFLENLWGRLEIISTKTQRYPELERRWEKDLELLGGNIGALIASFEELISDRGFDWNGARQVFDMTIQRVSQMEVFVDRFIELRGAKDAKATIEKARASSGDILQRSDAGGDTPISGERTKRSRKARVREYLFKQGESGGTLLHPERVGKRLEQLCRFYALFGVEKDELIDIAIDTARGHDLLWLKDQISLLSRGEGDESLRQEIEATLYYRREVFGNSPEALTHGEGENIALFTEKGVVRLSPPFREHHGILYGHTLIAGERTKCKCSLDVLRYGKPFSLEYLDRGKTRWKRALITPLFAWNEKHHPPKSPLEPREITPPLPVTLEGDDRSIPTEVLGQITTPHIIEENITPKRAEIRATDEKKGEETLLSRGISWVKRWWKG